MATIRKELRVGASADAAREFGQLHERLVPGFVTDTRLEGADRLVTFASGVTLRERLVTLDDAQRRLVWTSDLLPDELAAPTSASMDQGIAAMARALGGTGLADS